MVKCPAGRLKKPVRTKSGGLRVCKKMKKKTKRGRSMDRKKKSQEKHEKAYRKSKRKKRKCKHGVNKITKKCLKNPRK